MELEKLRELIESTKAFQANPACKKLADTFEEFIELFELQKEGPIDQEFTDRMDACLNQFWVSFDEAAVSLGISPDVIKQNMDNPEFFTPDQWASVQSLRKEVVGERSEPREATRKSKKRNKNVRI